ncbi:Oidioi.mRNA.OKI2018_I69.chr2.g7165.t1.cds [Oikopleura dioica]|uniref:E3 ubiquitin-protein ligase Hakai n=1 Tax=Oikopleura dioica TaxID=34765 RepID=A0ABN7TBC7_OIKDI|nr:Oidioi.mRNA.OKI2018_I69.chr2.g7165.t1.cds [Oikopleura dioica]
MGEGLEISDRNTTFNLIGRKDATHVFHNCECCRLPIVTYGRMIPCKHVFCFECSCQSRKTGGSCARCNDTVQRIEKCPRGTVFVCRIPSCRRTYLSHRDLTAHIRHRHKKVEAQAMGLQIMPTGAPGQAPVQPAAAQQGPPPTMNPGFSAGAVPGVLHHGQVKQEYPPQVKQEYAHSGIKQEYPTTPQRGPPPGNRPPHGMEQYGGTNPSPQQQMRRGPPPPSGGAGSQWGR